jgi:hypothetical protein
MYHPHLFARRAELLALRDLAPTLEISTTISPILEAVKEDSRDLLRCMQVMGEAGMVASVIVNPVDGDFKSGDAVEAWRQSLNERFQLFPSMLPAYVCRPKSTAQQIDAFLAAYPNRDVALLYWSPKISNPTLTDLVGRPRIRFHINLHNQMSAAQRGMLPTNKAVDVTDHFERCLRNADYGSPEFFSDDHLNYSTDSAGFGDFSIVGAQYIPGGGQAHAVAIHAIYKADDDALWVEHFISDDTDLDVGTVEGKYLQAASKLTEATAARPAEFGQDIALEGFAADVENSTFPGLAVSKRRQIYHHLALVHSLIYEP